MMKEQIKELRVKIDGLSQLVINLNIYQGDPSKISSGIPMKSISKEIEKAYDSLILAKAWLGKVLGELGEETPYKNDGNRKTVEDIEAATDKDDQLNWIDKGTWIDRSTGAGTTHIERVDWLRQEIKDIVEEVSNWYTHTPTPSREFAIARTNSYNYLSEARMWLGFELSRIRDESK